ncbi:MAG: hypothetical protein COT24_00970 [Candidatus Kerfeldbacteria bacterium CG08_land_8_20_14_0_20_40_16]|uniref:Nudix hydrolase domain-containing protein n=1 Tax=Candidatus Kerfeldbacteria bacterium CG08_land_8_20_14_0_20_40_16 TaxID=2014244 RepID=A0A2H0YWT3_9BACT|nr:MAG: hypothetical protein COT24_00970 [Candidatus Kerfeldbacteria bacterium CG08_land_8_20_14_0_20_40_16]
MAYHKNKKHPIPVVGAYVFNKQGKILLIKSKKYKDKYGGPGGHIEFGETIEQALKRELFEETGLLVSNPKLFDIKELINSKEYKKSGHFVSFRLYGCAFSDKVKLDPKEAYEYVWVYPKKALKMNVMEPTKQSIKKLIKLKKDGELS